MTASVVVARTNADGLEYLAEQTPLAWTKAERMATKFLSVREATRAAMRLPSRFRAYALPVYA